MSGIILGLLRLAPYAIEGGLAISGLITEALDKTPTKGPIEEYAAKALEIVPGMVLAGKGVEAATILYRTNEEVGVMIREVRGPTDDERSAQAARIKSLEDRLDRAAKPQT